MFLYNPIRPPEYPEGVQGSRFPSKMDWWLGLILVVSGLITVGVGWALFQAGKPEAWTLLAIPVFTGLMVFPCFYQVRDDILYIRAGLIRYSVKLDQIDRVSPSRSPLSSPALSLDRMLIEAGKFKILVSPADRVGFLQELQTYAPQLRMVGDEELKRVI